MEITDVRLKKFNTGAVYRGITCEYKKNYGEMEPEISQIENFVKNLNVEVVFEDFNQKVFNEYLDIHKVENRILSQILNREELDYKISQIYLDIEKNYKYTEKLVEDKIGQIPQQTMVVQYTGYALEEMFME